MDTADKTSKELNIINMFKELKETIFSKLKEWVVAITHRNMNKEIEINKRKQMEVLKFKSTLAEIKTILKD